MSYNRSFPYVQISKFGTCLNPVLTIDPVASSIFKDPDSNFDIGDSANQFGPSTTKSQLYMAEKCSKNWDGACEFLSRNNDDTKCNSGKISSSIFPTMYAPGRQNIGDFLVENSAVRRFCDLNSCSISEEPYDYSNPNSVWVKSYGCCGNNECLPLCMPPNDPDNDILLNKVLDKPDLHIDLLINMYRNVNQQNSRNKYQNTRIGHIFNIFDVYRNIHGNF
jgi:hypothetical protein